MAQKQGVDSTAPVSAFRALIIDDEPMLLSSLTAACADLGVEVVTAESLREGVLLLSTSPFKLVILDRHMPDYDAQGGVARLRHMPHGAGCLFLGTSGDARLPQVERWLADGLDLFVEKPIPLPVLRRVVEALREGRTPPGRIHLGHRWKGGAPLDPEVRRQITDLGRRTGSNLYGLMLSEFAVALRDRVAEMKKGLEAGDMRTTAAAAHALKGCARSLGAWPLAEDCAQLEKAGLACNTEAAHKAFAALEAAGEALKSQLPSGTEQAQAPRRSTDL